MGNSTLLWRRTKGLKHSKKFFGETPTTNLKTLELDRQSLRKLTWFATGHGPLGYQLKKTGRSDTDVCRFCATEVETAEHLLCDCDALSRSRYLRLGRDRLSLPLRGQITIGELLGFIRSLRLDE